MFCGGVNFFLSGIRKNIDIFNEGNENERTTRHGLESVLHNGTIEFGWTFLTK